MLGALLHSQFLLFLLILSPHFFQGGLRRTQIVDCGLPPSLFLGLQRVRGLAWSGSGFLDHLDLGSLFDLQILDQLHLSRQGAKRTTPPSFLVALNTLAIGQDSEARCLNRLEAFDSVQFLK